MLEPILNNILVEKLEEETNGVIIPDQQEKKAEGKGKVIAVGKGTRNIDGSISPLVIKKGDIVLFSRYSPTKLDGKEYLLTKEEWILAVIKNDNGKN
jgi:chaperonin GroES